jgi:hypothetical protein
MYAAETVSLSFAQFVDFCARYLPAKWQIADQSFAPTEAKTHSFIITAAVSRTEEVSHC